MARGAADRADGRTREPGAARPSCALPRGPWRPAACRHTPSRASRAYRVSPPRGSATAVGRRRPSYRHQLLNLARGLAETLHLLLGDDGREIAQLAVRREIQAAGRNRVGEMARDVDEVLRRFEDRAPPIDNAGNEPLVPTRAERLDVGLDQIHADGVHGKLLQLVEVWRGVAEIDVERQCHLQVTVEDLEGIAERRPILARDADVTQPGILQVD